MNIGITGHRHLGDPEAWHWVADAMQRELDRLSTPIVAVTCLAVGADQLFARLVATRSGRVRAILPFKDYARTFRPEEMDAYLNLLLSAEVEIIEVPGTDEDAFLAAGHRVVALADLLFAVWDSEPARGASGTANIVSIRDGGDAWLFANEAYVEFDTALGGVPSRKESHAKLVRGTPENTVYSMPHRATHQQLVLIIPYCNHCRSY